MARMVWMAVAVAAAGCGDAATAHRGDAATAVIDAATASVDATDPAADAAPTCDGTPIECATWLEDYQRRIVGTLSGEREIEPGLTLPARANSAQRAVAREFLQAEFEALGLDTALHDYGTGANVVAELTAAEVGAPIIIIGAHFERIGSSSSLSMRARLSANA